MAHRNRWLTWVYLLKIVIFHGKPLNNIQRFRHRPFFGSLRRSSPTASGAGRAWPSWDFTLVICYCSDFMISTLWYTKNYGKIHHFSWVNPLFRLGHFLCRKLLVYHNKVKLNRSNILPRVFGWGSWNISGGRACWSLLNMFAIVFNNALVFI